MAKKVITITQYMSELIYNVQNTTHLTGKSRLADNNEEQVANMQANDDDENANQVIRSVGNAFAHLKTKLSEYLVIQGTTANNAQISQEDNLQLVLQMPSNYNESANDTIAMGVHQFIVNTAIADWFAITNKDDAADYVARASGNLAEIREAINKRVRPVRKEVSDGE